MQTPTNNFAALASSRDAVLAVAGAAPRGAAQRQRSCLCLCPARNPKGAGGQRGLSKRCWPYAAGEGGRGGSFASTTVMTAVRRTTNRKLLMPPLTLDVPTTEVKYDTGSTVVVALWRSSTLQGLRAPPLRRCFGAG